MAARARAVLSLLTGLAACGTAPALPKTSPKWDEAAAARDWLLRQPEGCALGQSGPTLKPTDAFREARRRARAALLTSLEKVHQKTAALTSQDERGARHHEVILEQAEGWVRRATIVALWYDERGVGPSGAAGTAYAAACLGEGASAGTHEWMTAMEAHRAAPGWIYGGASPAGQLCALGVSGPTMEPKDAALNAEASARDELAEAIAARVKLAIGIFDDETFSGAVTDVPDDCRARAKEARIVATWSDAAGAGPIPYAGTSYARACVNL